MREKNPHQVKKDERYELLSLPGCRGLHFPHYRECRYSKPQNSKPAEVTTYDHQGTETSVKNIITGVAYIITSLAGMKVFIKAKSQTSTNVVEWGAIISRPSMVAMKITQVVIFMILRKTLVTIPMM